jgi:hypothetical protein
MGAAVGRRFANCPPRSAFVFYVAYYHPFRGLTELWRVSGDFLIPRRSDQDLLWISRRFQSWV